MELRDDAGVGPMRDAPGNAGCNGVMHLGGLHATENLAERAVQPAQPGVEGSIALVFVLGRCMLAGMPYSMRNRDLLRKQQKKHADELRKSTPDHDTPMMPHLQVSQPVCTGPEETA